MVGCSPKVEWIRNLPKDQHPNIQIPSGKYIRPTSPKSPLISKEFYLDWREEIVISAGGNFVKTWMEWKTEKNHSELRYKVGRGTLKQNGSWVLFQTKDLKVGNCILSEKKMPRGKNWFLSFPCPTPQNSDFVSFSHTLLYHFQKNNLVPLQYESGYEEANFGIAWESNEPYVETLLFTKARERFAKKEFQPHVYYHVKLD